MNTITAWLVKISRSQSENGLTVAYLKYRTERSKTVVVSLAMLGFSGVSSIAVAQTQPKVTTRIDAKQIMVGDQARLFLEVEHNPASGRLQWTVAPDTFNTLEIVERGKIDTVKKGESFVYRQRLTITGFDSGSFQIPAFKFPVIPTSGEAYTVMSDSLQLLVQTVAVDTTKDFKGIKGIIYVKTSWKDYIWYIVGGVVALILAIIAGIYIQKARKKQPVVIKGPEISLQDQMLKALADLENKQLWQKNKIKEYYIELTDIVRSYIEKRFDTHAMELTTDELLEKAQLNKEMLPYISSLSVVLHTADLAKFAKAQPLPQEHVDAMEKAREFIDRSRVLLYPVGNPLEIAVEAPLAPPPVVPATPNVTDTQVDDNSRWMRKESKTTPLDEFLKNHNEKPINNTDNPVE